jgi:hypothetical protein
MEAYQAYRALLDREEAMLKSDPWRLRKAWKQYLARHPETPWSPKAEKRLARVHEKIEAFEGKWNGVQTEAEAAFAGGDGKRGMKMLADFAREHPDAPQADTARRRPGARRWTTGSPRRGPRPARVISRRRAVSWKSCRSNMTRPLRESRR